MLGEEFLGFIEMLGLEDLGVELEETPTKAVADPEACLVSRDGRDGSDEEDQSDVGVQFVVQNSCGDQEGIAWQEGEE